MAQQTINIGASPNDGTGTPLRTAFQYTNSNFSELYTALGGGSGLPGSSGQVIFNDGGTNLAGDTGLTFNKTTDTLGTGRLTTSGDAIVCSSTGDFYVGTTLSPQFKVERATGAATITGDLTVRTNKLKVDSTGVAIGATSAAYLLDVRGTDTTNALIAGTTKGIRFVASASTSAIVGVDNTGAASYQPLSIGGSALDFSLSGSTAMTLNSTGLGVGTSNFAYKLNAAGFIAAVDPSFTGTGGSLIGAMLNNDNTAPGLDLRRWTGTAGTHGTTYIATDATGATFFYNGQQASNTKATSLKMTLDASGNLLVGKTTSGAYTNGTQLFPAGTVTTGHPNGTGSGAAYSIFAYDGVRTGDITQNGTTGVLYNTASDYRLKEQVQPLSGGLARVNALKPSVYKWKSDGSNGEGFLAHELAEVVPFAVSGEKDAVNEDGSIKSQGIDMSRVVPVLVAAIQELTARVQTLETR